MSKVDSNIQSLWDFDSVAAEDNTHAGILMYSLFTRQSAKGHQDLAGMVHRQAALIQQKHPKEDYEVLKKSIAGEVSAFFKGEKEWIKSEEAGESKLSDHQLRAYDSAIAKIVGAIGFGGDLEQLDTSNKCQDFNKKMRKAEADRNIAAELRQEAIVLGEREGLVEGTPEMEAFIKDYIAEQSGEDVEGSKGKESMDSNQVFGRKIAGILSKMSELGADENFILQAQHSAENYLQKKLEAFIAQKAAEAGVIDEPVAGANVA